MKYLLQILLVIMAFTFIQCNGKPDRPESVLNESQQAYDGADLNTSAPIATPPGTNEPPQNADGVWHYICPDGHPGGAGKAGPCPTCSKMLIHNAAYHQGQNTNTPNITATTGGGGQQIVQPGNTITFDPNNPEGSGTSQIQLNPGNATSITTPGQAKAPEPAQNAAGVWHYTCNNGCAGGAGSAIACAGCGTTLVHNSAYHQ